MIRRIVGWTHGMARRDKAGHKASRKEARLMAGSKISLQIQQNFPPFHDGRQ